MTDVNLKNNRLRPLFNLVKVLEDREKEITRGGIVIPQTALQLRQAKKLTGRIVSVGKGVESKAIKTIGARVLYGEYSGFTRQEGEDGEPSKEGKFYRYLREEDCLAVFEKEEPTDG
jgi:co-chaperonin GroES (HSP10)